MRAQGKLLPPRQKRQADSEIQNIPEQRHRNSGREPVMGEKKPNI